MSEKQFCMAMKINVDCNACCRKLRRILLKMKGIETHMIERERYRVMVFGRFRPADVAIKIRKKMNRRVEILDVEEMEADHQNQNQNPAPPEQPAPLEQNQNPMSNNDNYMFPCLEEEDSGRRMFMFPSSLAANHHHNHCPNFSSDFTLTSYPHPETFAPNHHCNDHYGYHPLAPHPDSLFSHHNYY